MVLQVNKLINDNLYLTRLNIFMRIGKIVTLLTHDDRLGRIWEYHILMNVPRFL